MFTTQLELELDRVNVFDGFSRQQMFVKRNLITIYLLLRVVGGLNVTLDSGGILLGGSNF